MTVSIECDNWQSHLFGENANRFLVRLNWRGSWRWRSLRFCLLGRDCTNAREGENNCKKDCPTKLISHCSTWRWILFVGCLSLWRVALRLVYDRLLACRTF